MTTTDDGALLRWRADPVAFIEEVLRDPETGRPFKLYGAEKRFLRKALKVTRAGRLPFPELLFSAPKKSGKTAFAAMITIYVIVVLGGRFAEAYCVANDLEQAQGRVFAAIVRIVEASPFFEGDVKRDGAEDHVRAHGCDHHGVGFGLCGRRGCEPDDHGV